MPIPIIAAVAIGLGSAALAGGGTGVYYSTKYKKQIAELQDEIRQLQEKLQKSHECERELLEKIAELEKQKSDLTTKIEVLTTENKELIEKIASFEIKLRRNDTIFRKIIATLTLKLGKLKEDNEILRAQISYFNMQIIHNENTNKEINCKIIDLESVRKQSIEDLCIVQSEIEDQENVIQDMEMEVNLIGK